MPRLIRSGDVEMTRIERLNAGRKVPRQSRALLGRDETRSVRVLGPIVEKSVLLRDALRDADSVYTTHRTVKVLVEGEKKPRRIEYSRLAEFSRRQESGDADE